MRHHWGQVGSRDPSWHDTFIHDGCCRCISVQEHFYVFLLEVVLAWAGRKGVVFVSFPRMVVVPRVCFGNPPLSPPAPVYGEAA